MARPRPPVFTFKKIQGFPKEDFRKLDGYCPKGLYKDGKWRPILALRQHKGKRWWEAPTGTGSFRKIEVDYDATSDAKLLASHLAALAAAEEIAWQGGPAIHAKREKGVHTLAEAIELWTATRKWKPSSATIFRREINKHITKSSLGERHVASFDDEEMQDLIDTKTPNTGHHLIYILKGAFKLAKKRKWIAVSPMVDIERKSLQPKKQARIRQDHVILVANELEELKGKERAALPLLICYGLGSRIGEPRNITAPGNVIDGRNGTWTIPSVTSKSNVAMTKQLMTPELIELARQTAVAVQTAPISWGACNGLLKRVCRGLGIPVTTSHAFRSAFITHAIKKYGLAMAQKMAGHRDPRTTLKYMAAPTEDEERKAMAEIARFRKKMSEAAKARKAESATERRAA